MVIFYKQTNYTLDKPVMSQGYKYDWPSGENITTSYWYK